MVLAKKLKRLVRGRLAVMNKSVQSLLSRCHRRLWLSRALANLGECLAGEAAELIAGASGGSAAPCRLRMSRTSGGTRQFRRRQFQDRFFNVFDLHGE